jgi:hypothetical protein
MAMQKEIKETPATIIYAINFSGTHLYKLAFIAVKPNI